MTRNLKLKSTVIIIGILATLSFSSCGQKDAYFRYNEIKEGQWKMHDTLFFEIDSSNYSVGVAYNLYLEVTNNVNYPYQNIHFFEWDNIANDTTLARTEKECLLADEFGKWKGTGFGSLFQSTFILKENITFSDKRNVSIKMLHGMQDEILTGIEKVGIRLSYRN